MDFFFKVTQEWFALEEPQAPKLQWICSDTMRKEFPSSLTRGTRPEDSPPKMLHRALTQHCTLVTGTKPLLPQHLTHR